MTYTMPKNNDEYKDVEQIEYNDWSAALKPEHKDYWAHMGYIAHFIASLLEDWKTEFKTDPNNPEKMINAPKKYNTIIVADYKEKFGQIRVYCHFADPELVEQFYKERNSNKLTLEQFREHCLRQDMLHYRSVYQIMRQCFPQYWHAISAAADNPELLFDSKEDYLIEMNKEINLTDAKWRPTSLEREKDLIFDLLKWK